MKNKTTKFDQPIIILGMHRSGTSILSKSLARMGLFTGAKLDLNDEAYFFLKINQWLLREMGADWDNPRPLDEIFENEKIFKLYTQILNKELSSFRCIEYLGLNRFVRDRSILNIGETWGWKDPRNVFTAPLWKSLYPNAKILHISRDGRDVARSIIERRSKRIDSLIPSDFNITRSVKTRVRYRGFGDTIAISDHNKAIGLWGLYEKRAMNIAKDHNENFMNIRYEDFIKNPLSNLLALREFCGIAAADEDVTLASKLIDSKKSGNEKKLSDSEITLQNIQLLAELGY